MKFNKINNPSDLILANHNWWINKGSLSENNPFSCYDRDEIIQENSYDSDVIMELNRYMITTDSQCGLSDDTFTPYHELCLDQRSEALGLPIDTLRKSVVRTEQRAYVEGFMTLKVAKQLSSILDKSKHDFSYIMFRPKSYNNDQIIMGDIKFFNDRVPLTTEFIKLESGEQIMHHFTNCPNLKSLLKYADSELDNIKNRLPRSRNRYVDELIHVRFIMNNFCEKGLMEKLLDLFQSI